MPARSRKSPAQKATTSNELDNNFDERRAARYLGISPAALRLWRSQNKGPRHYKAGAKLIRYRKLDLDLWVEARLSAAISVPTDEKTAHVA